MQALWDYPVLPYQAVVPWPSVWVNGHRDWHSASQLVQSWLEFSVGNRYSEWTWSMWMLNSSDLCGVSFRRESMCTLFLLRFSDSI